MATDRRLTLVINPDVTKFTEALDAMMSGVKRTTDQYTARWIEQAWTRPLAQSRARFMRDTHQLDADDGAIAAGLRCMRAGELPTALAVLVERDRVRRGLSTSGDWF